MNFVSKKVCIVGRSNTGKTYNLPECLKHMSIPKAIIIQSNTLSFQDYKKLLKKAYPKKNLLFDEDEPEGKKKYITVTMQNEITPSPLDDVENQEKFRAIGGTIYIIDDPNPDQLPYLSSLFLRGRHCFINPIIIFQTFFNIPLSIRINTTDLYIYRLSGETDSLYRAVANSFDRNKKKFDFYMSMLNKPENKYSCIYIDMDNDLGNKINILYNKEDESKEQ